VDIDRQYLYKISRNGVYLGLLPNVTSPFSYYQELGTAAVQLNIDVNQSLDTADEAPPILTTESGAWITTENEIPITAERSIEIIGNKDSGRIIANFNDIEVVEISSDHPNGITVFAGYISKWRTKAGSQDITTITCISNGKDLSDYIYGTNIYSLQTSQTSSTSPSAEALISPSFGFGIAQSISGLSISLSKITLRFSIPSSASGTTCTVTLKLYSGNITPGTVAYDAGGVLLSTVSADVTSLYPTYADVDFVLPAIVTLSGGNYYWTLESTDNVQPDGAYNSSNPYAGGQTYYYFGSAWHQSGTDDMYFKLYSSTSVVSDAVFTGVDPGNIVKQAVDGYRSQGGGVSYSASTIDLAGYTLNYTFKLASILEIIKKARELAPADWYWYVDPATQILYFKETLTTATHKFIIGKHAESFNIEASVEEIINVVYLTGGPTAGVNLLKQYTDTASLAVNKRGMDRLNDNRITDATTASTLGEAHIDENDEEIFRADPLAINAGTYDISTIDLGETVAFEGAGNFIDSLIFQVTAKDRNEDNIVLTLGKLPLKSDSYVDQIRRDLDNEQTLDNPNAPS
jgi:hypothetical protein